MVADLLFYMFSAVLLLGAVGVVTSKNAMYSVLFMVLSFFNAAGLFMLLGAEFLSLLLVMVYVGAIAVMFLFVLMTIDFEESRKKEGFVKRFPIGLIVALVMLVELVFALSSGMFGTHGTVLASLPMREEVQNIVQLGDVLFTNYVYAFLSVSMVLLIGMVGAIVLTHRKRDNVRKQDISSQIARKREDSIELVNPQPGKGVS